MTMTLNEIAIILLILEGTNLTYRHPFFFSEREKGDLPTIHEILPHRLSVAREGYQRDNGER